MHCDHFISFSNSRHGYDIFITKVNQKILESNAKGVIYALLRLGNDAQLAEDLVPAPGSRNMHRRNGGIFRTTPMSRKNFWPY
jgi:hypothetical protein